jgi:hypothetical protein
MLQNQIHDNEASPLKHHNIQAHIGKKIRSIYQVFQDKEAKRYDVSAIM